MADRHASVSHSNSPQNICSLLMTQARIVRSFPSGRCQSDMLNLSILHNKTDMKGLVHTLQLEIGSKHNTCICEVYS